MNKPTLFLKSHIGTYTKKSGAVVNAHDDKRAPAQVKTEYSAPKPKSHQKFHEEAAAGVADSPEHKAEHDRLMERYGNSKADWERTSINRQMSHNLVRRQDAKAHETYKAAMDASDHAMKHGAPEHHKAALDAISEAKKHPGGVGYAARGEELARMEKTHREAGGEVKHELRNHRDPKKADADVQSRRGDLESKGFKHEKTEPNAFGTTHHYAHEDGSRALVARMDPTASDNGQTKVNSYINTTNKGKKKAGPVIIAGKSD